MCLFAALYLLTQLIKYRNLVSWILQAGVAFLTTAIYRQEKIDEQQQIEVPASRITAEMNLYVEPLKSETASQAAVYSEVSSFIFACRQDSKHKDCKISKPYGSLAG